MLLPKNRCFSSNFGNKELSAPRNMLLFCAICRFLNRDVSIRMRNNADSKSILFGAYSRRRKGLITDSISSAPLEQFAMFASIFGEHLFTKWRMTIGNHFWQWRIFANNISPLFLQQFSTKQLPL